MANLTTFGSSRTIMDWILWLTDNLFFLHQEMHFKLAHRSLSKYKIDILDSDRFDHRIAKVLIVAAHADDEALGCIGLVQEHVRAGSQVFWLVVADGRSAYRHAKSLAWMTKQRLHEANRVRTVMRWKQLFWWGEKSPISFTKGLATRYSDLVSSLHPTLVYAPFPYNHHPEHRTVALMVATGTPDNIPIRWYPVQIPLTPAFSGAIYVDSALAKLTKNLLSIYTSQQFMSRSFRATIYLQFLEGILYLNRKMPAQTYCEIPTKYRADLAMLLAKAAEEEMPLKPNVPTQLWRDYSRLWNQTRRVAQEVNWREKVMESSQ